MKYLTVKEAAKKIRVNPATIRLHLRQGTLKGYKGPRKWLISPKDLQDFVREGIMTHEDMWNALKQHIEGGTQVISKRSLMEKMKQLEDRYTEELMGFFDGGKS